MKESNLHPDCRDAPSQPATGKDATFPAPDDAATDVEKDPKQAADSKRQQKSGERLEDYLA